MPATLKDVAKLAGVHSSTVSRVLRGKESFRIPKETQDKIIAAAKELSYQPDQGARALRLKKSHTIGLIVPDISNPFFFFFSRTIEINSFETGFTFIVCNTNYHQEKENHFLNELLSRRIDGLIIAPVQGSKEKINELLDKNFPVVLIDRYFEDMETNAIISDNCETAYQVVKYFAEHGHKRIAFIKGQSGIYTIAKRLEGYKKAVQDFGLVNEPGLIAGGGFCIEDGYNATQVVLNGSKNPTALLVSGNLLTVGVIKAITEKGMSIPQDISIIAYEDNVFTPYLAAPVTVIAHPVEEMGKKAFSLLMEHLEAKIKISYSKIVVKSRIEIRDSVRRV